MDNDTISRQAAIDVIKTSRCLVNALKKTWNETDIPVSEILKVIGKEPLYGHKSGKLQKTHWMAFMKMEEENEA